MTIKAGKLRKRVTVQAKTAAADAYGEMVETWAESAVVWGELTALLTGTREAFGASGMQFEARVNYQCRMRHRALSPTTNRLVIDGKTFEITGVMDPDGRGSEILAMCYEVQV